MNSILLWYGHLPTECTIIRDVNMLTVNPDKQIACKNCMQGQWLFQDKYLLFQISCFIYLFNKPYFEVSRKDE